MILTWTYTDTGGRPYNEDTVRVKTLGGERACIVLADGLGGHGGGDQASQIAAEHITAGWNGTATPESLTQLVLQAHQKVVAAQSQAVKMKSTVVALSIEGGKADWAYVGDSRLYHFENGSIVYQTKDHSASQIAVVLGQITPDQIRFHEDRSRIFRALGQEGDLSVDAAEKALSPGDHAFLLCSDGFWEYVLENEMEQTLGSASSPEDWVERMRGILKGRIPQDNDNNTAAAVWVTV